MTGLRLIVVAAVLLLALATSGVRAAASDSWNSPATESWPSLEEFANEIELSHREFADVMSASSSATGMTQSSSSTGVNVVSSSSSTGVNVVSSSSSTAVNKPSSSSSTGANKPSSSSSTGVNKPSSSSSTGVSKPSSSSTGTVKVSSSSSSSTAAAADAVPVTTYQPAVMSVTAPYNASSVPGGSAEAYASILAASISLAAGNATVNVTACFIPISSDATTCDGASSSRRLLQAEATKMLLVIVIIPANPSDPSASIIAQGMANQLGCGSNTTCQAEQSAAMTAQLQAVAPAGVVVQPAPILSDALATAAADNPAVAAALASGLPITLVPGSLSTGEIVTFVVSSSSSSSSTGSDAAALNAQPAPTVATAGHANGTNSGYYVEAAVLALSCILSSVYMVMHKVDPSAVGKSHYTANADAALAPVPSAEPARGPVSVVNPDEAAPLGNQGQMDYMSVFALRNNVLEHKDNTPAEDNSNQDDVHFILHQ